MLLFQCVIWLFATTRSLEMKAPDSEGGDRVSFDTTRRLDYTSRTERIARLVELIAETKSVEEPRFERGTQHSAYSCATGSLEVHKPSSGHGDVCRNEGKAWTCPIGCDQVAGAPYCVWEGTSTKCHESTLPDSATTTVKEIAATQATLTPPMVVQDDYILVPGWSSTRGKAEYDVEAQYSSPTTVTLKMEVKAPTVSEDSFFVGFDTADIAEMFAFHIETQGDEFHWETLDTTFDLAPGRHTLTVGHREYGAMLRRIRIASGNANFVINGANSGPEVDCNDLNQFTDEAFVACEMCRSTLDGTYGKVRTVDHRVLSALGTARQEALKTFLDATNSEIWAHQSNTPADDQTCFTTRKKSGAQYTAAEITQIKTLIDTIWQAGTSAKLTTVKANLAAVAGVIKTTPLEVDIFKRIIDLAASAAFDAAMGGGRRIDDNFALPAPNDATELDGNAAFRWGISFNGTLPEKVYLVPTEAVTGGGLVPNGIGNNIGGSGKSGNMEFTRLYYHLEAEYNHLEANYYQGFLEPLMSVNDGAAKYSLKSSNVLATAADRIIDFTDYTQGKNTTWGLTSAPQFTLAPLLNYIDLLSMLPFPVEGLLDSFKVSKMEVGWETGASKTLCFKSIRLEAPRLTVEDIFGLLGDDVINGKGVCEFLGDPDECKDKIGELALQIDLETAGTIGCAADDTNLMLTFFARPNKNANWNLLGDSSIQATIATGEEGSPSMVGILAIDMDGIARKLRGLTQDLLGVASDESVADEFLEFCEKIGDFFLDFGFKKLAVGLATNKFTIGGFKDPGQAGSFASGNGWTGPANTILAAQTFRPQKTPAVDSDKFIVPIWGRPDDGLTFNNYGDNDDVENGLTIFTTVQTSKCLPEQEICQWFNKATGGADLTAKLNFPIPEGSELSVEGEFSLSSGNIRVGKANITDASFGMRGAYDWSMATITEIGIFAAIGLEVDDCPMKFHGNLAMAIENGISLSVTIGVLATASKATEYWFPFQEAIPQLSVRYASLGGTIVMYGGAAPTLEKFYVTGEFMLAKKGKYTDCIKNLATKGETWRSECLVIGGGFQKDDGEDDDQWAWFKMSSLTVGQIANIFDIVDINEIPKLIRDTGFHVPAGAAAGTDALTVAYSTNGFESSDHDTLENLPDSISIDAGITFEGYMNIFDYEVRLKFQLNNNEEEGGPLLLAEAELDPIDIGPLEVTAYQDKSKGPSFEIKLCGNDDCGIGATVKVNGELHFGNHLSAQCNINFTTDNGGSLDAAISGNFRGVAMSGEIQATGFTNWAALVQGDLAMAAKLDFDTGGVRNHLTGVVNGLVDTITKVANAAEDAVESLRDEIMDLKQNCYVNCLRGVCGHNYMKVKGTAGSGKYFGFKWADLQDVKDDIDDSTDEVDNLHMKLCRDGDDYWDGKMFFAKNSNTGCGSASDCTSTGRRAAKDASRDEKKWKRLRTGDQIVRNGKDCPKDEATCADDFEEAQFCTHNDDYFDLRDSVTSPLSKDDCKERCKDQAKKVGSGCCSYNNNKESSNKGRCLYMAGGELTSSGQLLNHQSLLCGYKPLRRRKHDYFHDKYPEFMGLLESSSVDGPSARSAYDEMDFDDDRSLDEEVFAVEEDRALRARALTELIREKGFDAEALAEFQRKPRFFGAICKGTCKVGCGLLGLAMDLAKEILNELTPIITGMRDFVNTLLTPITNFVTMILSKLPSLKVGFRGSLDTLGDNASGEIMFKVQIRDAENGGSEVYQNCMEDASTKHRNGCLAYHEGWLKTKQQSCHSCKGVTKDYTSCDLEECNAFCDDQYRVVTSADKTYNKDLCRRGCTFMSENGACGVIFEKTLELDLQDVSATAQKIGEEIIKQVSSFGLDITNAVNEKKNDLLAPLTNKIRDLGKALKIKSIEKLGRRRQSQDRAPSFSNPTGIRSSLRSTLTEALEKLTDMREFEELEIAPPVYSSTFGRLSQTLEMKNPTE